MSQTNIIEIAGLTKKFGEVIALHGVDLEIRQGEFFSLLGPSGCGKTTLLRLIAGFMEPTAGTISIAGNPMTGIPPNLRPTNMVFQSYAIFPHLNVARNVAYGLRKKRLSKAEREERVRAALDMVDLAGYGARNSHELSGGQRQRVALARALVMQPKVLLLDEPLSALDKKLREQMQLELRQLQRSVGITFILITHDQEEALTMSDRIAVMFDGRIAQIASPRDLYQRPASRDVAGFIGGMNFIPADVIRCDNGRVHVESAGLGAFSFPATADAAVKPGPTVLGVRPERFALHFEKPAAQNWVETEITDLVFFGEGTYYYAALPGMEAPITISAANTGNAAAAEAGRRAWLTWDEDAIVPLG